MRKLHFFSTLVTLYFATLQLGAVPTGALPGIFSVDCDKYVYFSQGNLQYNSNNQQWQFAAHQWDIIGGNGGSGNVSPYDAASGNNSITVDGKANNTGVADLFGWVGASSSWTGLKQYGITSSTSSYGYGYVKTENLKSDWGSLMGTGWFTLSVHEWSYLFKTRTGDKASTVNGTTDCRFTKARVNSVSGFILFPDGGSFASSEFSTFTASSLNSESAGYETITCDASKWNALEVKGCVFLPAAGFRNGTSVYRAGSDWFYWSSSHGTSSSTDDAICWVLPSGSNTRRYTGFAVRLVQDAPGDAPTASISTAPAANTLTYTGSAQALVSAGTASGGTMKYKLSTAGSYSASIPTATNAGTYYVNYMVDGTACFNDFTPDPNTIEVTIAQADYTPSGSYSISGNNLSYTGSSQALVSVTGSVTDGTIWYKLGDGDWSDQIPTAIAIGDYHVWYKVVPSNSNYKDTEPVEVLASITIPTVTDNSDAATINAVLALNPTDLMVQRTIYRNGEYNTICLPFALDADALAASPLAGFNNLKTIKGASISGTAPDLSIDIFVEDVTEMEAGKPYLISYPSANENIVNPVFTGITVSTTEPGNVEADGITFQGMFAQVHIDPYTAEREQDYLFLGANSQLMWPLSTETSESVKMRGFRAYFIIDRTVITSAAAPSGTRARFVNAPKQPTSIENTELNTQAQKLLENGQLIILKNGIKYNAQGQVLK